MSGAHTGGPQWWMVDTPTHQERQPVIGKPVPPAKRKHRATKPAKPKRRKRRRR